MKAVHQYPVFRVPAMPTLLTLAAPGLYLLEIGDQVIDLGNAELKHRHLRAVMTDNDPFRERFLQILQRIAPAQIAEVRRPRVGTLARTSGCMTGRAIFPCDTLAARRIALGDGSGLDEAKQNCERQDKLRREVIRVHEASFAAAAGTPMTCINPCINLQGLSRVVLNH